MRTSEKNSFSLKKLISNEDGGITIEAVLWLPVFIGLLSMTVDASSLMASQTRLYALTSDASRMVSLGVMTETEATEWVAGAAGPEQTFTVQISQDANSVTTLATMPFSDAAGLGILTKFSGTLRAQATYRKEPAT